tara:strand:- start:2418 stop:3296 length:879 start_codon:yes stop_codon:yes gene_type:complete
MQNNIPRKGIILAGGKGTRLYPITKALSKQLLPIYDKPMIYYPLTTLMLAGVKEILIITTEDDLENFKKLLGNGNQFGISIEYKIQYVPGGIAEALKIGKSFINSNKIILILGDNIFYGDGLTSQLEKAHENNGATIFAYYVKDPERYGVIEFDNNSNTVGIVEKPKIAKSNYVVTGMYFYDETAVEKSFSLKPSTRGELEITDLNLLYLKSNGIKTVKLGRGTAWLDTGTFESLNEAGNYIKAIENRQNLKIGCPEEVAWRKGLIDSEELLNLAKPLLKSEYGKYLLQLIN